MGISISSFLHWLLGGDVQLHRVRTDTFPNPERGRASLTSFLTAFETLEHAYPLSPYFPSHLRLPASAAVGCQCCHTLDCSRLTGCSFGTSGSDCIGRKQSDFTRCDVETLPGLSPVSSWTKATKVMVRGILWIYTKFVCNVC